MNGFQTRSALVRHAERGLGIRHRPDHAREIECVHSPDSNEPKRETGSMLAAAAVGAFIGIALVLAQNLPGA